MVCTSCGSTIADKAIICYRCGAPTAQPVVRPPAASRPRRTWILVAVLAVVVASVVLVRACSLV